MESGLGNKLEYRPRVGEEHPFPLSANWRQVIIHRKPRSQGGRRKTDHRWPFVDQLIYYLLVKGPIRPDHQTGRLRASAETLDEPMMNEAGDGHTLLWWCCRRTELPTGLPTGVLRPSGRTELLEALSGWWRESSDEETKGPRCGVRLWGPATSRVVAGDCWLVWMRSSHKRQRPNFTPRYTSDEFWRG